MKTMTARTQCAQRGHGSWVLFNIIVLLLSRTEATYNTKEPEIIKSSVLTRSDVIESTLTQKLDHFHSNNTQTWNMRYMYNPEHASTTNGQYIIIYVGGEWTITAASLTAGLMYEIAQELGAALFYTEHRYYGDSRPYETTETENLRYLSVDQALADLAYFIQYIKSDQFENGRYANAAVGLGGCSYAGSMVTWMMNTYPHLVSAGISLSGPLHAQDDFPEYLETITEALRSKGGEQCVDSIRESMEALVQLTSTENGGQIISEKFITCGAVNTTEPLDLASFFWYGITETFAYLVQTSREGDIETACEALTNTSYSDPVDRLASWINTNYYSSCIETNYEVVVANHRNTSYSSNDLVMRLWSYQLCTEYGWYQTTTSSDQPFLDTVPLQYFHRQCRDFYAEYYDASTVTRGVYRTNMFYGGVEYLPDYLISIGGLDDPWYPMGPVTSPNPELSPVFMIPDTSHCAALRSTGADRTSQMAVARNRTKQLMVSWMTGVEITSSASFVYANIFLLVVLYIIVVFK